MSEAVYLRTLTAEKPAYEFRHGRLSQKPYRLRPQVEVSRVLIDALLPLDRERFGYLAWSATTDFSMPDDTWFAVPDMSWWAPGRLVSREDGVFLPPTLAIEFVYAGSDPAALRGKCVEYRSRGVDVCWLIDPIRRAVEVFDAGREGLELPADATLQSQHVPGFSLPISELWTTQA